MPPSFAHTSYLVPHPCLHSNQSSGTAPSVLRQRRANFPPQPPICATISLICHRHPLRRQPSPNFPPKISHFRTLFGNMDWDYSVKSLCSSSPPVARGSGGEVADNFTPNGGDTPSKGAFSDTTQGRIVRTKTIFRQAAFTLPPYAVGR